jgi:hypothetical protein
VLEPFLDLLTAEEIEVLGDISEKVVEHLRDRQHVARNP